MGEGELLSLARAEEDFTQGTLRSRPGQSSPVQCRPVRFSVFCFALKLISAQPTHILQVHFDIDFHFHFPFSFSFQFLFLLQFLSFDYLLGLIRNAISFSVGANAEATANALAECA